MPESHGPTEDEKAVLKVDAPDDATVAEAGDVSREQVGMSGVEATREWRRRARARVAANEVQRFGGISPVTAGHYPRSVPGDPVKRAARINERSVPRHLPGHKLVAWVNRIAGRADALELAEGNAQDPRTDVVELAQATVGNDGADVRAQRDTRSRNAERVRDAQREAVSAAREES